MHGMHDPCRKKKCGRLRRSPTIPAKRNAVHNHNVAHSRFAHLHEEALRAGFGIGAPNLFAMRSNTVEV